MKIHFEEQNGAQVVRPEFARLDALVASDFRSQVVEKVNGRSTVVLDLAQINFMDSSGLGSLVSILKHVPAGGQLRLANVHQNVAMLLKLTRLEKIFPTFGSLADALNA